MKKLWVIFVVLLTLPAFLFIFQPGWQLGGLGLLLGVIGNFISPVLILYLLYYYARKEWS
jgi:hypothetical protein